MTNPPLTVSRGVIAAMIRQASLEVPGVLRVGRGGPGWQAWLAGSPVDTRIEDGRVAVRVWLVVRPAQALPPLTSQVRAVVAATIERLLGLQPGPITVVVDGVAA